MSVDAACLVMVRSVVLVAVAVKCCACRVAVNGVVFAVVVHGCVCGGCCGVCACRVVNADWKCKVRVVEKRVWEKRALRVWSEACPRVGAQTSSSGEPSACSSTPQQRWG